MHTVCIAEIFELVMQQQLTKILISVITSLKSVFNPADGMIILAARFC